jgi:hypothetical protein
MKKALQQEIKMLENLKRESEENLFSSITPEVISYYKGSIDTLNSAIFRLYQILKSEVK